MSDRSEVSGALAAGDARKLLEIAAKAAERLGNPRVLQILRYINSIAEVLFNPQAPTARLVLRAGRYSIEFNAEFIRRHVDSGEALLHLLLHEILHKIRGDLTRPLPPELRADRARHLSNFAADMLINSDLERYVFPTPPYFLRLYDPLEFPANLLLPPRLLLSNGEDLRLDRETLLGLAEDRFAASRRPAEMKDLDAAEVARVYLSAWMEDISFEGLLRALDRLLPDLPERRLPEILWLGDHRCEGG